MSHLLSLRPSLFFDGEVDCPQTRPYKLFDGFKLYVVPLGELGTAPQSPPREVSTGVLAYRWSPDGEGLLLLREVSTQCFEGDAIGFTLAELVEYDLETAEEERLFIVALHPYVALYAALFPRAILDWNGYEILLVTGPTVIGSTEEGMGNYHPYLYLLTPSYGEAFIGSDALYPAFSPTGEKLAFIRGATLPTDIVGECRGEIVFLDLYQLEGPKQLAGPGCFSQLFWLSEEELGYVEETEEGAIIWVHELTTGERFNLSAALVAHLSPDG